MCKEFKRGAAISVGVLLMFIFALPQIVGAVFLGTGTGTLEDPYLISTCAELQSVPNNVVGGTYYKLSQNIDCTMTNPASGNWTAEGVWGDSKGFLPIDGFAGTLDGNNKIINGLFINRTTNSVGILNTTHGAIIKNLGVEMANITGAMGTGGIVGHAESITITDSHFSGNLFATGSEIGGLIGSTTWQSNSVISITNSYTSGNISHHDGNYGAGGLIGGFCGSCSLTINSSFSEANVTGGSYVGGLLGDVNDAFTINNSYSTGNIHGYRDVGGLVSLNYSDSAISNSYSSGNVTATNNNVGGFTGGNYNSPLLNNFSTGLVTANPGTRAGGFIGRLSGDIQASINNFFDSTSSGYTNCATNLSSQPIQSTSGKCEAVNQDGTNPNYFKGNNTNAPLNAWDFDTIWQVNAGALPTLRAFAVPDTTAPVITLNGEASLSLEEGLTYTELGATATDDIDGDLTANIEIDASSVNTTLPGTYFVTYNVKDSSDNSAVEVKRTITITAKPIVVADVKPSRSRSSGSRPSVAISSSQANEKVEESKLADVATNNSEVVQTPVLSILRTLKFKMVGEDVKNLQIYLNTHGYPISASGAGSSGLETTLFGSLTKKAVMAFQKANNLSADGIVGPMTRQLMK